MKGLKTIYWIATGLLTLIMLFSSFMYLFNNLFVTEVFIKLGYPTYLIYPLATAKILGLVAILFLRNRSLRDWAYAGFFFNTLLALSAHLSIGDGQYAGALIALIAVIVSYTTRKKISGK
tara:strand:+ start:63 stop:422 length:360 start_codon:yes stop_codon:yes gene_type:complete